MSAHCECGSPLESIGFVEVAVWWVARSFAIHAIFATMVSHAILEIRALGGEEFKLELERWLRDEQQQGDLMVVEVFRCLREDYLCSLLLPKGVQWPVVPKSHNFMFLFFLLLSLVTIYTSQKP